VPAAPLQALAAGPEALPEAVGAAPAEAAAAAEGPGPGPFWERRIRLLPYTSVGRGAGLLCAVRPDGLWLRAGSGRRPVRALVAVSAVPLDPQGMYAALVPASLGEPAALGAR
jgi:hypothetical protein